MTCLVASLTKKIIRGRPYYYLRECQRVNGKPTIIWQKYIGSAEQLSARLSEPAVPQTVRIREFGASMAALAIARKLGLVEIIDRHVRKRGARGLSVGQYLQVAVLNRCVAPRSKSRLAAWYDQTVLPRSLGIKTSQLSSQRFWDNMHRIDADAVLAIERELSCAAIAQFGLELRCLLFDATNFFTFVDSFNDRSTLAQRGHSKEGRANLRIVGLALLVTADGEVPLFHHTYAGNQHDATTFGSVSDELAARCRTLSDGACDVTVVFDKGNNSGDNLDAVGRSGYHFVGSLVPTHHPRLLATQRSRMTRLDRTKLPSVWSYRTTKKVFGVERTVLVTFNQPLFDAQSKTLRREIRKRKDKLARLQASLARWVAGSVRGKQPTLASARKRVDAILTGRHMKELFKADVRPGSRGSPKLIWSFRDDAWRRLQQTLLGKTLLFTDRAEWSDEEIVLAYRSQSHVEAAFRAMKDPRFLTFRPTFHWTDAHLRVHALYCVIALMILTLMRRQLANAALPMSLARMIERLSDVREVALVLANGNDGATSVRTVLSETDAEQSKMLAALGISPNTAP